MRRRAGSFIRRELKEKFADAGAAFDAANLLKHGCLKGIYHPNRETRLR